MLAEALGVQEVPSKFKSFDNVEEHHRFCGRDNVPLEPIIKATTTTVSSARYLLLLPMTSDTSASSAIVFRTENCDPAEVSDASAHNGHKQDAAHRQ